MNNLELMRQRLEYLGGTTQQDRMVKQKYKSLIDALGNSYQSAVVYREGEEKDKLCPIRALINPNTLKHDYDDKIISIPFEREYRIGDIFEWAGTNTYWLIYARQETETAYFRGKIRKCEYVLSWKNEEDKILSTRAAIIGPRGVRLGVDNIETAILATPTDTISITMPDKPEIISNFKRTKRFMFAGRAWKVQSIDNITNPGVFSVYALEDYKNEDTDTDNVIDELVIKPVDPNPAPSPLAAYIVGESFIKPLGFYIYEIKNTIDISSWTIKEKYPHVLIESVDNKSVKIKWTKTISGQFTLVYNEEVEKIIVVESLF